MIAYNKTWLGNLFIREETEAAFEMGCISPEEKQAVWGRYELPFYSPNIFIRIGLFILTTVIMLFSLGLISLLMLNDIENAMGTLLILFSIISIACLEYFIKRKHHFRSGVDDALLWNAAMALFAGIALQIKPGNLSICLIIFVISFFSIMRYADRIMAAFSFISLLGIFFFTCVHIGTKAIFLLPLIIMAISFICYWLVKRSKKYFVLSMYSGCLLIMEILSLLMLYIAGNYCIVTELSNSFFDLQLLPGQSIPYGFIFWISTVVIPFSYLLRGIQKKDVILIRVGLLLVAAIVFTVRYYRPILSPEFAMLVAGLLMISVAWALTRYLRIPRFGFTVKEVKPATVNAGIQIESLVVAATFSEQPTPETGTQYGGGSFGGGGANADF